MARIKSLAGRPIAQHSSPNGGGKMSDHRGIVLHIAQGSYGGTVAWQLNPDQRYADGTAVTTCSTWIVGKEPGEWAQMVDTNDIAWCQRDGSRAWLSIELAGFAPAAPSVWQVEACAQLLVWVHEQYGIPIAVADHPGERGLGHHSFDREWLGEEFGHDECPGAGVIGAKAAIVKRAKEIVEGDEDVELTDDVSCVNAATGRRWSFGEVMDRDGISVNAALGHAASADHRIRRWVQPGIESIRADLARAAAGQVALAAAIEALAAGGTSVDTAAVIAAVERVRDDLGAEVAEVRQELAEARAEADGLRQRLADALAAGAEG
ncbi:MAG TPA: N-acetylmuramoyl-L-alanine amidase [Candidatus Limnocylindrales bacterium]